MHEVKSIHIGIDIFQMKGPIEAGRSAGGWTDAEESEAVEPRKKCWRMD